MKDKTVLIIGIGCITAAYMTQALQGKDGILFTAFTNVIVGLIVYCVGAKRNGKSGSNNNNP